MCFSIVLSNKRICDDDDDDDDDDDNNYWINWWLFDNFITVTWLL